jgi:hypothetical protein
LRRAKEAKIAPCFGCRHFVNDPKQIEASIPGLSALSSAYASVRAEAGLCLRLDLFLSPRAECGYFEPGGTEKK